MYSSINGKLHDIGVLGIPIPRYSQAGTYTLSITTNDAAGNSHVYAAQDLAILGFASTLPATDTDADSTPPTLTSLTFIPNHINTSPQASR